MRSSRVRTNQEVKDYITSNYFPTAAPSDIDELLKLYPQDVTQGSPYDTGFQNAITPQFKRLASVQGDMTFQGARRFFLQHVSKRQHAWSFRTIVHQLPTGFWLTVFSEQEVQNTARVGVCEYRSATSPLSDAL